MGEREKREIERERVGEKTEEKQSEKERKESSVDRWEGSEKAARWFVQTGG